MRIVTDSRAPGEPKDAENSHLFTIYRAFATPAQSAAFRKQLEEGMGWATPSSSCSIIWNSCWRRCAKSTST